MGKLEKLKAALSKEQSEFLFGELCYNKETFEEIKDVLDGDCGDSLSEIADGNISVYTADQMEWLADNVGRADQEEAINCGAKTAQEIAAFCWYSCERQDLEEMAEEIRGIVEEIDEEEDEE